MIGRVVELAANMRPTAQLQGMRLAAAPALIGGADLLERATGGEISMRVVAAPGIPGKFLGAVVEQWPDGHYEILGACHTESEEAAFIVILPKYREIKAARKG